MRAEKYINELARLVFKGLYPLNVTMFLSQGDKEPFRCLYAKDSGFTVGKKYSLYDIRPLFRFLMEKTNSMNKDIANQIWSDEEREDVCYVLEWDDHARKIIIFHTGDSLHFDKYQFSEIIKKSAPQINHIFRRVFYSTKKSDCMVNL